MPPPGELTKRQAQVLSYWLKYQRAHGLPPTFRECAKAFRMASPNAPKCHLVALHKKGFLKALKRGNRTRYVAIDPGPGLDPASAPKAKRKAVRS